MAKKKKQQEERKPDLASPDQEVIEEKIKNMLDINEPEETDNEKPQIHDKTDKTEPKKLDVKFEEASSAPELPDKSLEDSEDKSDDTDLFEDKPEKVVKLDDTPKEDTLLEEMKTKAQESLEKKESKDNDNVPEIDEPLLENETESKVDEVKEDDYVVASELQEKIPNESEPSNLGLESKETAKAVDDIVAKESDKLLEIEDQRFTKQKKQAKKHYRGGVGKFFKNLWSNRKAKWAIILICVVLLAVTLILPEARYFLLNSLGVRASAKVTVLDESTGQPLKNVNVELSSLSAKTDSSGVATLTDVRLGTSQLKIEKVAFAPISKNVTISLGSNNLESTKIQPTGIQYSFAVTDYLSGKPVDKVEAISGEASAFSDGEGKIKLTTNPTDKESLEIDLVAEDYRTEAITIPASTNTETSAAMVPSKKHVFVSKRTGKYDLYSIDVDGKNDKLLLSGTGNEKEDIALSYRPLSNFAALVSTRDNEKNKDGFLLSNLNVVSVESGETKTVASSERIQLIDWIGDRLIFVQAVSGISNNDPGRHKLLSYDTKSNETNEIASSNYFNDVLVADGRVYFAPSSAYQNGATAFYRVEADGSGKTTLLEQEVWNIIRTDYENLALSSQNSWFNVRIGEEKATSLTSQPTSLASRIYSDSPDKKSSLWVDDRDGKGVLLNYQVNAKNDLSIVSASGLRIPVNWLNKEDIVYRVSNEQETADYIVSLNGGEPKKIVDVTNTNSLDNWYHY